MGFNLNFKNLGKAIGVVGGIPGIFAGNYIGRKLDQASNQKLKDNLASEREANKANADAAEQARLKAIADQSVMEEEQRKKTTLAGSSIQSVLDRKKLLGA